MRLSVVLLIASCCLAPSFGAKILSLLLMPSPSHSILLERLVRELANRGHEITYITATVPSKPIANMTVIHLPGLHEHMLRQMMGGTSDARPSMLSLKNNSFLTMVGRFKGMATVMTEYAMSQPSVQEFLNQEHKFDLIFGEIMMNEAMLAGFSHKYKAPIVALAPFLPNLFANYLVGNPSPSAFIPDSLSSFTDRMTFIERLSNFLLTTVLEFAHWMFMMPLQDSLVRKYFGEDYPYVTDILKNTSLVLVNSHYGLAFPRPYVPNMIEVGGMHVNEPKPLPEDLQKFMDESKNGVIFFSLGSNVRSSDMPPEFISGILKAFGRLKQNVLWKFEEELESVPKNVRIQKWLPQSDILAHPNLKLFITHGGMLSTTEAVLRGVPMIGIPIFGDQFINMKLTEATGSGRTLNYDDINEESLYSLIVEMTANPKYKESALERSTIVKDNPMSPLDTAIWWIEYVIRHEGAHHLRSAAQDLTWYQYYLLDVYMTIFIALAVSSYISVKLFKCTVGRLLCKFCKKVDQTKKNN